MKNLLMRLLFVALLATCGCARHYVIRLNNGGQITTTSKPRLQRGSWYFKDSKGNPQTVPAGRVTEIGPASMMKDDKSMFKPETR